jgi:hypothetical protein
MKTDSEKIQEAIDMILDYGGFDGGHHKQWVLDQALRILTGDDYERQITNWQDGEDGPQTYLWDCGIAP